MKILSSLEVIFKSPLSYAKRYSNNKVLFKHILIIFITILFLMITLVFQLNPGIFAVENESPRVIVLSDRTMSMDIFYNGTDQKIFENVSLKIPAKYYQFTGEKSSIGDNVIQAAQKNNSIVLLSDGNNNYGRDLFDAITSVTNNGTRVFAIKKESKFKDLSVEITGPKNIIVGHTNNFDIFVRKVGNETSYSLDLLIDGSSVKSEIITQTERIKIIPFSYVFNSLGAHEVTVQIVPYSEDRFSFNNVFYKSVFVVPKPEILVVTDNTSELYTGRCTIGCELISATQNTTTPLYILLKGLYTITATPEIPENLTQYKAILIDNKEASQLYTETLEKYVNDGGGLVVVGGNHAYDKGYYNNSPIEILLPAFSKGEEFKKRNLIIVLDASGSMFSEDPRTGISFMGIASANAINILRNMERNSDIGVVSFGANISNSSLLPMGKDVNRAALEKYIKEIRPRKFNDPTALNKGLRSAEELLNSTSGTKEIIIISDGLIPPETFEEIKAEAIDLKTKNIEMYFVQVRMSYEESREPIKFYKEIAIASGAQPVVVLNPDERASVLLGIESRPSPTPAQMPETTNEYPIEAIDTNDLITKYVTITASVTGFNDITQKPGASKLIATKDGKSIITTWGFGNGRVAAVSTDNGAGMTMWAPAIYSGENASLISGIMDWAIGDPRGKEGVIVQTEDIWGGTQGRVRVKSNIPVQLKFEGNELSLSNTGPSTYETTINSDRTGFHDLSGYGVAVNYPIEYRDIGFNEKLAMVIESNGGHVYKEGEIEEFLKDLKEINRNRRGI